MDHCHQFTQCPISTAAMLVVEVSSRQILMSTDAAATVISKAISSQLSRQYNDNDERRQQNNGIKESISTSPELNNRRLAKALVGINIDTLICGFDIKSSKLIGKPDGEGGSRVQKALLMFEKLLKIYDRDGGGLVVGEMEQAKPSTTSMTAYSLLSSALAVKSSSTTDCASSNSLQHLSKTETNPSKLNNVFKWIYVCIHRVKADTSSSDHDIWFLDDARSLRDSAYLAFEQVKMEQMLNSSSESREAAETRSVQSNLARMGRRHSNAGLPSNATVQQHSPLSTTASPATPISIPTGNKTEASVSSSSSRSRAVSEIPLQKIVKATTTTSNPSQAENLLEYPSSILIKLNPFGRVQQIYPLTSLHGRNIEILRNRFIMRVVHSDDMSILCAGLKKAAIDGQSEFKVRWDWTALENEMSSITPRHSDPLAKIIATSSSNNNNTTNKIIGSDALSSDNSAPIATPVSQTGSSPSPLDHFSSSMKTYDNINTPNIFDHSSSPGTLIRGLSQTGIQLDESCFDDDYGMFAFPLDIASERMEKAVDDAFQDTLSGSPVSVVSDMMSSAAGSSIPIISSFLRQVSWSQQQQQNGPTSPTPPPPPPSHTSVSQSSSVSRSSYSHLMYNILSSSLSPPVQAIKTALSLDRDAPVASLTRHSNTNNTTSSSIRESTTQDNTVPTARRVLDFDGKSTSSGGSGVLLTAFQVYKISSGKSSCTPSHHSHGNNQELNEEASLICVVKSLVGCEEENVPTTRVVSSLSPFEQSQALVGSFYEQIQSQLGNALPSFISAKK